MNDDHSLSYVTTYVVTFLFSSFLSVVMIATNMRHTSDKTIKLYLADCLSGHTKSLLFHLIAISVCFYLLSFSNHAEKSRYLIAVFSGLLGALSLIDKITSYTLTGFNIALLGLVIFICAENGMLPDDNWIIIFTIVCIVSFLLDCTSADLIGLLSIGLLLESQANHAGVFFIITTVMYLLLPTFSNRTKESGYPMYPVLLKSLMVTLILTALPGVLSA